MYKDPIVDEVRKIREEQAKEYDFDLQKIFDQPIKRQKASGHPTVSFAAGDKIIQHKIAQ